MKEYRINEYGKQVYKVNRAVGLRVFANRGHEAMNDRRHKWIQIRTTH